MMGKNCVVKEKVKITNCIIMDNVTIDEGYVLYKFNLWTCFTVIFPIKRKIEQVCLDSTIHRSSFSLYSHV